MFGLGSRKQPRCLREPGMTDQANSISSNEVIATHANRTERSQRFWIGVIALVAVNLFWGMSFPLVRGCWKRFEQYPCMQLSATESADVVARSQHKLEGSSFILGMRFGLATIFIFFFPGMLRGQTWLTVRYGGVIGIVFAIGLILQVVGLESISASRSGFLTSLSVVYVPIAAWLLFKQRIDGLVWLGALLALVGTCFLTGVFDPPTEPAIAQVVDQGSAKNQADRAGQTSSFGVGDVLTLLAATFFTAHIFLVDHASKHINPAKLTPWMFASCSIFCHIVMAASSGLRGEPTFILSLYKSASADWVWWLHISMLVVACSLCAFYLMNRFQAYVSPAQASILYCLEPSLPLCGRWSFPSSSIP